MASDGDWAMGDRVQILCEPMSFGAILSHGADGTVAVTLDDGRAVFVDRSAVRPVRQ